MRIVRFMLIQLGLASALTATALSVQAQPLPPPRPMPPPPPGAVVTVAPGAHPLSYRLRLRDYEERMRLKKLTVIEQRDYDQLKAEQVRYVNALAEAERKEEETRAARRAEALRLQLLSFPNIAGDPIVRAEFAHSLAARSDSRTAPGRRAG